MKHAIKIVSDKRRTGPKDGDYLLHRGWLDVIVDEKLWGRISMQTHGCHGATHELRQVEADEPNGYVITETSRSGRYEHTKYKEWSDKTYKFHVDPKIGFIPLAERLREMVKRAIKADDLVDPDILATRRQADFERCREIEREEEHKKEVRFDLRARRVIAVMRDQPRNEDRLLAEIKAAMQWAQKQ